MSSAPYLPVELLLINVAVLVMGKEKPRRRKEVPLYYSKYYR